MTARPFNPALAATAREQYGVISLGEARATGADPRALSRLSERGLLDNRGHGVLAVVGAPSNPYQEAWQAVLSVGLPCALRAQWALWARRLLPGDPPSPPQIAIPNHRKLVRRDDAVIRRINWWYDQAQVDELIELGGLPVLSPIDSLVTAAAHISDAALLTALQEARHRRIVDITELIRRRRRGLPGSTRIGRVAATYLAGHDSTYEVTTYAVLTAGDDTGMHRNVVLVDGEGNRLGPVDGYHEDGAAYEADGPAGHSSRQAKDRDRWKDSCAGRMGIPMPRFTPEQICDPTTARARWLDARRIAREAGVGRRLRVEHLPGRGCSCGHRPAP